MGWFERLLHMFGDVDWSTVAVVFSVPDRRLREMDVATGPCLPIGGRKRPLRTPSAQDHGEGPEQTATLYTVLSGRPSHEALTLLEAKGKGSLYAFSEASFAAMLADDEVAGAILDQDKPGEAGVGLDLFIRRQEELSAAWIATGVWPRAVTGTNHRLRTGLAREAAAKGNRVFVWYGPAVKDDHAPSGMPLVFGNDG